MATFILNDETVTNSYGFKIPTAGIDLKRFTANPVMLDSHYNSTSAVLGRWKNIQKADNGLLTAEDDFDEADDKAAIIKGKVERGFIKGCSMGVTFNRDHFAQQPDGTWLLQQCELYEASICAIPSNSAALRLYAAETGELLTETEVKMQLNTLQNQPVNLQNMYKISLTIAALAALNLQNTNDGVALAAAIEKLVTEKANLEQELETEQTAREALEKALTEHTAAAIKEVLDAAELSGKITAATRPGFEHMAKQNMALCEKVLASIPAKTSLQKQVNNPAFTGEVKTEADFQKLSLTQQLAWKEANVEAYKKLFA